MPTLEILRPASSPFFIFLRSTFCLLSLYPFFGVKTRPENLKMIFYFRISFHARISKPLGPTVKKSWSLLKLETGIGAKNEESGGEGRPRERKMLPFFAKTGKKKELSCPVVVQTRKAKFTLESKAKLRCYLFSQNAFKHGRLATSLSKHNSIVQIFFKWTTIFFFQIYIYKFFFQNGRTKHLSCFDFFSGHYFLLQRFFLI